MTQKTPQLRLVADMPLPSALPAKADPVRQVFEHWLFMLGKSPARCKLDATRSGAIRAALLLFDAGELMLAAEGFATDAWACSDNRTGKPLDIEWLMAKASRIEHYAEQGEQLRAQATQAAHAPAQQPAAQVDPAEAEAQRERLRALAQQLRRQGGAHG